MADTARTLAQLLASFADNIIGAITAQDGRDLCVSALGYQASRPPTPNDDDVNTGGTGQFFGPGSTWIDTATPEVWFCLSGTPGAALWLRRCCSEVYNVMEYGAVGNGIADDAPAIRRALAAAALVDGAVFFPQGTYGIGSTIALPNNVTLYGVPSGSVVKSIAGFEVLFSATSLTNLHIQDLIFDGGSALTGIGLYLLGSTVDVLNCFFQNFTRTAASIATCGVFMYSCTNCIIDNCQTTNCGYNSGAGGAPAGAVIFGDGVCDGCVISNCKMYCVGIFCTGGFNYNNCAIINNYVNQGNVGTALNTNNGYGILAYAGPGLQCTRNIIAYNRVQNCFGTGIYLNQNTEVICLGNSVSNVALGQDTGSLRVGGIVSNTGTRNLLEGNIINTVGGTQTNVVCGIGCVVDTRSELKNNKIYNIVAPTGHGINMDGSGTPVVNFGTSVIGNTIDTTTKQGIYVGNGQSHQFIQITNNHIYNTGLYAINCQQMFDSRVTNNVIRNWGAAQVGIYFQAGASASRQNVIAHNTVGTDVAQSGTAIRIETPGNVISFNFLCGAATIAVGIRDTATPLTGPPAEYNLYEGNSFFQVTTQFSLTGGQVAMRGGNYNTGSGPPATTPWIVGEEYFDSANLTYWRAVAAAAGGWSPGGVRGGSYTVKIAVDFTQLTAAGAVTSGAITLQNPMPAYSTLRAAIWQVTAAQSFAGGSVMGTTFQLRKNGATLLGSSAAWTVGANTEGDFTPFTGNNWNFFAVSTDYLELAWTVSGDTANHLTQGHATLWLIITALPAPP